MTNILQQPDSVLRNIAKDVPVEDIQTPKIQKVLSDMKKMLDSQEDGVAIAAPQIGASLRIFLISGSALQKAKNHETSENEIVEDDHQQKEKLKDIVFINPIIIKLSKKTMWMEEGCLSVRYLYGKVKRSMKATIVAYDENGKKFERGGSGILAQVFQHETDHLDGVLFIDKAKDVEDIPPESENKKENGKEK